MTKERKDGRPITMEDFYFLLHDFSSSVSYEVRKFSTEINKLLDRLDSSKGLIKAMEINAGTQWLSDDELEIYDNTYQTVYEIYDKLEEEIELIKQHQEKLYRLIRQLDKITADKAFK
jgi:DNA repair ATPase RecN